jgi:NhaP-type Na+/H+ or K+/H+ antiporter
MSLQVAAQAVTFAVLAVVGMAVIMTPLMLYAFDLEASGWHWSHAALFTCMIASTDAVAVTAVLKKANGPESLAVLMEGESLFNDATSIVLFEVCTLLSEHTTADSAVRHYRCYGSCAEHLGRRLCDAWVTVLSVFSESSVGRH